MISLIKLITVIHLILAQTEGMLKLIEAVLPSSNHSFISVNPQLNNIVSITDFTDTQILSFQSSNSNSNYEQNTSSLNISWFMTRNLSSIQVRSWYKTSNLTSSSRLLIFNSEYLIERVNFGLNYSYQKWFGSNHSIVDAIYGETENEIYVLLQSGTGMGTFFNLTRIVNYTLAQNSINFPTHNNYYYDKMLYNNNRIFLLFTTFVQIMAANHLQCLHSYLFGNFVVKKLDMDVTSDNILVLARNTQINFYNISQFPPKSGAVGTESLNQSASLINITTNQIPFEYTGIKVISSCYIMIGFDSTIVQYNYKTGLLMHRFNFTQFNLSFSNTHQIDVSETTGQIVAYVRNTLSNAYYILDVNDSYNCGFSNYTSCSAGYTLNAMKFCQKSGNQTCLVNYAFNSSTNDIDNSTNQANGTGNTTSSNVTTSATENQQTNSPSKNAFVPPVPDANNKAGYLEGIDNETVGNLSMVIGAGLTLCSIKITPNFLFSFIGFIDDIWLYYYHQRYHSIEYPQTVYYFLSQSNFIAQLKINPFLNSMINTLSQSVIGVTQNDQLIQYFNLTQEKDVENIYFLNSSESIYKVNIPLDFIYFIILKLIYEALNACQTENKVIKFLKNELSTNKWWVLLIGIIEINMVQMSFNCALQLLYPSFSNGMEKINFILTCIIFFVLNLYTFTSYPLIYTYAKRKISKILLTKTKFKLKSFFLQPTLTTYRNLLRAFAHGFFIFSYSSQITPLFTLDLMSIFFVVKMRKLFKSPIILFCTLAYNVVFLVFDLFFLLEQMYLQTKVIYMRELFGLITVCLLGGFALLLSLYFIAEDIVDLCRLIVKRYFNQDNRVMNSPVEQLKIGHIPDKLERKTNVKISDFVQKYHENSVQNDSTYNLLIKIKNANDYESDSKQRKTNKIKKEKKVTFLLNKNNKFKF